MSTTERATQVVLGGTRGGPDVPTLRTDRWWLQPVVTVSILTAFVIYSTWSAFNPHNYYAGAALGRDLISPFYSPCLASSCAAGSRAGFFLQGWPLSPALLILIFPLGFRLTCYYYRRSYYRAFWWSPPACAVSDKPPKAITALLIIIRSAPYYIRTPALRAIAAPLSHGNPKRIRPIEPCNLTGSRFPRTLVSLKSPGARTGSQREIWGTGLSEKRGYHGSKSSRKSFRPDAA